MTGNESEKDATDNLLKALSKINNVQSTRKESSKPYFRQASPKIEDHATTSLHAQLSSINATAGTYSSLLNTFQTLSAGNTSGDEVTHIRFNDEEVTHIARHSFPPLAPIPAAATVEEPFSIANFTNILIDIVKPVIPPPRQSFECLVCYTQFFVDEGALGCSPEFPDENAEKHLICVTCVRGYAHSSIVDGHVAHGGLGLKCVTDKCKNIVLLSDFEHYLSDEDYVPLKTRLQEQCLLDAGLADLVTCPECSYKIIIEPSVTFYTCNCGRIQCRNCPRLYDEHHQRRTCEQMVQYELQQASSRKLEPQMSEIMIRNCHRCKLAFVKSNGCNKMTCRCGATQCYVCRASDIGYDHFCNCGTNVNGPCGNCGKSCRTNTNVARLDEQKIKQLRNNANAAVRV